MLDSNYRRILASGGKRCSDIQRMDVVWKILEGIYFMKSLTTTTPTTTTKDYSASRSKWEQLDTPLLPLK